MERFFQLAAIILIASAAVFYFYGNIDGVFISIVLGCLSYFLSVRFQVKARLAEREALREAEEMSEPGQTDSFVAPEPTREETEL